MKNDDAKWVERILAGDTDAFTTLVKKYEKQITRVRMAEGQGLPRRRRNYAGYFSQGLRKTWVH